MNEITILIPFYNEERNIVRQLKDIIDNISKLKNYKFKLLLVDDGSIDEGAKKVENFFLNNPKIEYNLIKHQKNLGKTQTFATAFKVVESDYILFMDGDYQDDPNEIAKFIEKIDDGFDVIIGNQEKKPGLVKGFAASIYRNLLNNLLKTNIKTHSPQFYAIKFNYLKGMSLYKNDHRYLVIIALYKGAKYCEIKVNYLKREYGKSKFSKFKIIGAIIDTLRLISRLKYGIYKKRS